MNRKIKLQQQLLMSLLGLSGIIVVLLWAFQILLFPTVYRFIKINQVKNMSETIVNSWPVADESLKMLAMHNDACLLLIDQGREFVAVTNPLDCVLTQYNQQDIKGLVEKAVINKGYYELVIDRELGEMRPGMGRKQQSSQLILVNAKAEQLTVIVSGNLQALDATKRVFGSVVMTLSFLLVSASFILSVILSKYLSQPIETLNQQVRMLGDGNYQVDFTDSAIEEFSQLSSSLSDTANRLGVVDRMRSELVANVSHDFKTPLTMIKGYAELMRDLPNESTVENVNVIIDEADYLNRLVDDLLRLSSLEAGVINLELAEFDIVKLVNEMVKKQQRFTDKLIEVKAPGLLIVQADLIKVRQIVQNLLINALQHADQLIMIKIEQIDDHWELVFVNDGDKIDGQTDKLWERYYRNSNKAGTGLGLAIVKRLVELHQGKVTVQSVENKVEFIIQLPLVIDKSKN
jgi:signal transduction histidine kinase